jgi:hypothetical protein
MGDSYARSISATCVNCGRHAYDENYWSRMPDGEILYWTDLCVHEYEPGGPVTCDCGMLCPHCQTPEQRDAQRKSGEWELSNSSTIAPRGFKGILLVEMDAQDEDQDWPEPEVVAVQDSLPGLS